MEQLESGYNNAHFHSLSFAFTQQANQSGVRPKDPPKRKQREKLPLSER